MTERCSGVFLYGKAADPRLLQFDARTRVTLNTPWR